MRAKLSQTFNLLSLRPSFEQPAELRYSVAELESLKKLLSASDPRFVQEPARDATTFATIKVAGGTFELVASNNVTSITDMGVGELTITFAEDIGPDAIPRIASADGSVAYEVTARTASALSLKFHSPEPSLLKVWLED